MARLVAFTDQLTGVKSKHAYAVHEGMIETSISPLETRIENRNRSFCKFYISEDGLFCYTTLGLKVNRTCL